MNDTYKLDEKGIPYRVSAGMELDTRALAEGAVAVAFQIAEPAALTGAGAGTGHERTIGLLRHKGQLRSFRLYFF